MNRRMILETVRSRMCKEENDHPSPSTHSIVLLITAALCNYFILFLDKLTSYECGISPRHSRRQ